MLFKFFCVLCKESLLHTNSFSKSITQMKANPTPALYARHTSSSQTIPSSKISRQEAFFRHVKNVIHQQIDNEQFDVSYLADVLCLSVSQLNRRLKACIDCSAGMLIRTIRMRRAAELLAKDIASVGEIAYRVGYKNQANFCRSFKQWYGCAPREYSKQRAIKFLKAQK